MQQLVTALEYEYSMMAQSVPFEGKSGDMAEQFMRAVVPRMWPSVMNGLQTLDGGRWEIISHTVTRVGGQMLATFVLRRPA
jgi:hypothetical protein